MARSKDRIQQPDQSSGAVERMFKGTSFAILLYLSAGGKKKRPRGRGLDADAHQSQKEPPMPIYN